MYSKLTNLESLIGQEIKLTLFLERRYIALKAYTHKNYVLNRVRLLVY